MASCSLLPLLRRWLAVAAGENSIIVVGGANTSDEWEISDEITLAIQGAGAVLLQREIPEARGWAGGRGGKQGGVEGRRQRSQPCRLLRAALGGCASEAGQARSNRWAGCGSGEGHHLHLQGGVSPLHSPPPEIWAPPPPFLLPHTPKWATRLPTLVVKVVKVYLHCFLPLMLPPSLSLQCRSPAAARWPA